MSFVPRLYGYWRSSASWRVRWAFALKGRDFEYVPVNILAGENQGADHKRRHPLGMLPVLEIAPGRYLAESLAMLEWIDETWPDSPLLYPGSAAERAAVRSLCETINSGTAPLQTPRVQKRHSDEPGEREAWAAHFTREGLRAFNELRKALVLWTGKPDVFSLGPEPTAADLCLVPQIYNARRFNIDVAAEFPELARIYDASLATESCRKAAPESQIDAPETR